MDFHHVSVLLNETIEHLNLKNGGTYVDCTLGGGGHTWEIVRRIGPKGRVIGIDQDKNALEAARLRLAEYKDNLIFVHSNFNRLKEIIASLDIPCVDGVVFDLGVSSHQLDEASRGFSYMHDAPLDMRMNTGDDYTAANLVNEADEAELTRIIRTYGEEKWAARIAKFICERRAESPIKTTGELVEIIKKAIPAAARREGPHPAKRTFQAIRIAVNDELNRFALALKDAVDITCPGGRICVISFHSLEDRIAKDVFRELAGTCECPPDFPVCRCNKKREIKIITRKPIIPSDDECNNNPRARSAKLRVAERVGF